MLRKFSINNEACAHIGGPVNKLKGKSLRSKPTTVVATTGLDTTHNVGYDGHCQLLVIELVQRSNNLRLLGLNGSGAHTDTLVLFRQTHRIGAHDWGHPRGTSTHTSTKRHRVPEALRSSLPTIRVALSRSSSHDLERSKSAAPRCLVHSTNRPYSGAATPQSQHAFGADSIAAESSSHAGYSHCSSPRLDPPFSHPPLKENCTTPFLRVWLSQTCFR